MEARIKNKHIYFLISNIYIHFMDEIEKFNYQYTTINCLIFVGFKITCTYGPGKVNSQLSIKFSTLKPPFWPQVD